MFTEPLFTQGIVKTSAIGIANSKLQKHQPSPAFPDKTTTKAKTRHGPAGVVSGAMASFLWSHGEHERFNQYGASPTGAPAETGKE